MFCLRIFCWNFDFPKQDDKWALVTGGSRGIGLEIVHNLLQCGYNVIIGSSSPEEKRNILQTTLQRKFMKCEVEVWHLDLASLKSVKQFAEKYLLTKTSLHLLINNAGIMFVKEETTEDGYEKHFAVNYLSHSLLTMLLLPLLSKSGTHEKHSRIVNCTSCIHYVGNNDLLNFKEWKYYSKHKAYIQSKLAQVLFTYSLHQKLQTNKINVDVNCVHPGVVNTDLMTSALILPFIGALFLKTAKDGADTATYVALSPDIEGNGGNYLEDKTILQSSKQSYNVKLQQTFWSKTIEELQQWMDVEKFNELIKK
ncbi:polyprenol dehydrogenase isoform X2 [Parasteatoda tepidariorum]|uniref:polyprenol dehydrogenase isoform X2 n=1 Tax=Parasteatoda tepidariorum TaxID=114398 RepID=UPI0039BC777D